MTFFQNYLLSLTAASLLTGLCQSVMPPGTVKRVSAFTCSLLLFVVMARPLLQMDYALLLSRWESASAALAVHDETLEQTSYSLTQQLIVEQLEAYIQDKAEEKGIRCEAAVFCREENGLPVPDSVEVHGAVKETERETLMKLMEEELGIERERILFLTEEGGAAG